jgi:hypothetical protein
MTRETPMDEKSEHVWVIDALDEGVARVEEDGARMIVVPRYLLPTGAHEGQLLRVTRGEGKSKTSVTITIVVDEKGTAREMRRSKEMTAATLAASKKRDPGGDVAL